MKKYVRTIIATLIFALAIIWGGKSDAFAISQADADKSPEIKVNEVKTDKLESKGSELWYKVNITEPGYFRVTFGPSSDAKDDEINWGWNCKLYKKGDLTSEIVELDHVTESETTSWLAYSPDTFYIKVENNQNTNNFTCAFAPFDLKVEFNKSDVWEREENDKVTQANQINVNTIYYGVMGHKDDVDWFKFTVTEGGICSFTLSPDLNYADIEKLNSGWDMTIYSGDLKKEIVNIAGIEKPTDSDKIKLNKGTYVVEIKCTNSYVSSLAPVKQPYDLRVNFEGYSTAIAKAKVSGIKVKAGKKKATVSWKKISYASGYEIYRSTKANKGFKKIATVKGSKSKYVSKKLKSKKKYFYKVRAFVTVGSKKYYSLDSAVKKVKVK